MYDPKDILTEEGYEAYLAHLHNIRAGLQYLLNHADDLHIGAKSRAQDEAWSNLVGGWNELETVLKTGDGEQDE